MNKLKISLDIDDTIAGFTISYKKRFKTDPKYDWCITRNVNNILIHEKEFWLNLPVIEMPNFTPRMYCSARVSPKRWTKEYLSNNGFPDAPLYQVPGYKLSKASALKGRCDVHIEDSIKNFLDLNSKGIPCLLYNPTIEYPVLKIYSLDYNEIEEVYWLAKEMGVFNDFNKYFANGN